MQGSLPHTIERRTVQVFGEAGTAAATVRPDALAAEVPVALVFNGISHAVMMATPQALEDFALGFALSEGILDHADDCRGIDVALVAGAPGLPAGIAGVEVRLEISPRAFERLKQRRRSLAGRTGCGVCGVESFAALDLASPLVRSTLSACPDATTVLRAIAQLRDHQPLNAEAGSLHAAGWADAAGTLHAVLEDVGRHNALDKLIGRQAREGRLAEPGFVVMTSRASHELVRKCARVGIGALATISAPTTLGIDVAVQSGVALWGLCRAPRAVRYA